MRLATLLAVLALASPALAQEVDPPRITVTGEAVVSVPPDLALIESGISTEAKSAREASDTNNAAMGKLLLALKGAGIDEKDLQTQRLSLQPQYPQERRGPNAVTGYRATNRVEVKLRDLTRVATIVDLMVGAGANEIGGVTFTVGQPSKLLDDARTQAMADARRKAEIYARAAGVELGAAIAIQEQSAGGGPLFRRMAAPMTASAPIAQGEETLRISVSASWAIKGGK
jgi:uncharacterized protein YggE